MAWTTTVFAGRTPEESRTLEQKAALALGATLTDELVAAGALLFAAPLYNFGVSQHFKTWVDIVVTCLRMAAGFGGHPTPIFGLSGRRAATRTTSMASSEP
jgi:FMN-dependent NADH-azoreductase